MKLRWVGHSCFLITAKSGLSIITDPYHTKQGVNYSPVMEIADIVTVSHDHFDHNAVQSVGGRPEVVKSSGNKSIKGIEFRGIACYHDESSGKQRGENIIFCFSVDGIRICHLGDLGHALNRGQIKEIGEVDVLLVPVGGFYTIDAAVATRVCDDIKPKVVVPMHYKTAKLDFPVTGVDVFLAGKKNVKKLDSSKVEFEHDTLPAETGILVLKPSS
jgi:L-ascorbate metabolism protein UlaG (beta-lactamase superfamily)